MITECVTRVERLNPQARHLQNFVVADNKIVQWSSNLGPQPTEAELLAVDLTQPTAEERDLERIKEILSRFETATAAEKWEAVGKFLRKRING